MSSKLSTWLESDEIRNRIGSAVGKAFDPDYYMGQMLIALSDPNLAACSDKSKFQAAHTCASLGMLPTLGHVALIPRNLKHEGTVCTVMPQWQGLQALMLRHPDIQRITHSLVHVSDHFEYDGTTQTVVAHEYDPFDDDRQFNSLSDIRGGYLRIKFKDGRPDVFHMVKRSTIEKARSCAQATNIWDKWTEEQAIKTLYRNGFARRVVPIDPMVNQLQIQEALKQEDVVLQNNPDAVTITAPKAVTSRTEALKQRVLPPPEKKPEPEPEPVQETEPEQAGPSAVELLADAIRNAEDLQELESVNAEIVMMAKDANVADEDIHALNSLMDVRAKEIESGVPA